MLKKLLALAVLLSFTVCGSAWADSSRTLEKKEELHPQGWSVGDTIKFKKKTAVRLNDFGEVISGTLADDTYLRPQGWQRIINDHYFVSAYTGGGWFPRHHRYWPGGVYNIALSSYGHLRYKDNTAVTFSKQGTLAEDTQLRPVGWQQNMADNSNAGFVEFKKGTRVYFDEHGLVTAGTLKKAAPWKAGGTVITLEEKTAYKFTANGAEKAPAA